MSAEENKALALRTIEALVKEGPEASFAMFDPTCTFPDLALYGLPPTLEGFQQFAKAVRAAFSDASTTVEEIIAEGEIVMVWGMDHLTHTGPWLNIPATNKRVSFRLAECFYFAHGKVIEYRSLFDAVSLLQQIGAVSYQRYQGRQDVLPERATCSAETSLPGKRSSTMSTADNEALIRRAFEVLNQGNMGEADKYFTTNFVCHDAANPHVSNREEYSQLLKPNPFEYFV
jgi:predicted ester cyclase